MPADSLLKTVFLPLALFIIMFGMGMSLTPADFLRVVRRPKAKLVGLLCQLILLPLAALGLVTLFGMGGELAVGMMLIAACPGGATSNIISHLSKGDTALSVSLTAVTSVVTVFTIPLLVGASLEHFMDAGVEIAMPFGKTVLQLTVITILPISLGMGLHRLRPGWTRRMGKGFTVLSLTFLALIILAAVLKEENLAGQFRKAGVPAALLNVLTLCIGFGVAALAGLETRQRITIAIESGIQNGTLALGIALGLLESPGIAMPAVVYSLIMFGTGGAVIAWRSRSTKSG